MKRIVLLLVLAIVGFYIAWPAWSGYRIAKAFETDDAALLEAKIDFSSVRASLRPTVAAEVERTFERTKRDAGPLGALIAGQLKGDLTQRLVDNAINGVITPPNVLRIAREGGNVKQAMERVLVEQMAGGRGPGDGGGRQPGGLGALAGKLGGQRPAAPEPVAAPPASPEGNPGKAKRSFGLANVKRFSIDGPLGFSVGVARDPAQGEPDVTAQLRFTGGDWKVVGLIPRN